MNLSAMHLVEVIMGQDGLKKALLIQSSILSWEVGSSGLSGVSLETVCMKKHYACEKY